MCYEEGEAGPSSHQKYKKNLKKYNMSWKYL